MCTCLGFVCFVNAVQLSTAQKLLGYDKKLHMEVAKGSILDNINYCTKEATRKPGTEPTIHGDAPDEAGKGARTDLIRASELAKLGDFKSIDPTSFIKYNSGLYKLYMLHNPAPVRLPPISICYYGTTGTGKSTRAFTEAGDGAYVKPAGPWWDGYAGQDTVVFDDFRPADFDITNLLRVLDKWPMWVPFKGGFHALRAHKFFITSNEHPQLWYPKDSAAVCRRLKIVQMTKPMFVPQPVQPGDAWQPQNGNPVVDFYNRPVPLRPAPIWVGPDPNAPILNAGHVAQSPHMTPEEAKLVEPMSAAEEAAILDQMARTANEDLALMIGSPIDPKAGSVPSPLALPMPALQAHNVIDLTKDLDYVPPTQPTPMSESQQRFFDSHSGLTSVGHK